jgi:hypothetical protein
LYKGCAMGVAIVILRTSCGSKDDYGDPHGSGVHHKCLTHGSQHAVQQARLKSERSMHYPCCCCAKIHGIPRQGHKQCKPPHHERTLSRHNVLNSSTVTAHCPYSFDVLTGGSALQAW